MNYPEILEQYNNDELNQLKMKNGVIKTKGFWDDLWSTAESWYDAIESTITEWWDHGGKDVIKQDAAGATSGALVGFAVGSWTGPGAVGAACFGAAVAGLGASTHEAMVQWLDSL